MPRLMEYVLTRKIEEQAHVHAFSRTDALEQASQQASVLWKTLSKDVQAVETDHELRGAMMKIIHDAWDRLDEEFCKQLWALQDGYGTPGYMPEQGYDWSGIRDSTLPAVQAMFILAAGR